MAMTEAQAWREVAVLAVVPSVFALIGLAHRLVDRRHITVRTWCAMIDRYDAHRNNIGLTWSNEEMRVAGSLTALWLAHEAEEDAP